MPSVNGVLLVGFIPEVITYLQKIPFEFITFITRLPSGTHNKNQH